MQTVIPIFDMFSYYGSKTSIADRYPVPKHDQIIEPFAGAAKYSLLHFDREVLLVDKYETIIEVWKWLQQCSPSDIIKLPTFKPGQTLDEFTWDCQAQRDFMGFIIAVGDATPRRRISDRASVTRPYRVPTRLKTVADNLFKIKHWKFVHGSFEDVENKVATWFIDPPYQHEGGYYKHSNRDIDYNQLAQWSMERLGQVIVCENTKADWMPFKPMVQFKGSAHVTTEAIWCNEPTAFDHIQLKLL